ncbi:MAG: ceramidase domain-containing protein, partial [Pseudomonadota bacterium]
CERMGPEFWAEPLNAVTNLSFIVAALVCARAASGSRDALAYILCAILFAIGVGSFLWHTVAEPWAGAADTIPILLFILTYLYAAIVRYLGLPFWAGLLGPVAFIAFAIGFAAAWNALMPSVNGSEGYFPVIILLAGFGVLLRTRAHPAAGALLTASGLFAVSLFFRSIDDAICQAVPIGSHTLWHLLNGLLLGIVLMAFIRHGRRSLAPAGARG